MNPPSMHTFVRERCLETLLPCHYFESFETRSNVWLFLFTIHVRRVLGISAEMIFTQSFFVRRLKFMRVQYRLVILTVTLIIGKLMYADHMLSHLIKLKYFQARSIVLLGLYSIIIDIFHCLSRKKKRKTVFHANIYVNTPSACILPSVWYSIVFVGRMSDKYFWKAIHYTYLLYLFVLKTWRKK